MSEPVGRINVSEDKLDAKLAGLELRLVDRITAALDAKADVVVVEGVRARVHALESAAQGNIWMGEAARDIETRVRRLERFKNAIPSTALLGLVVSIASIVVAVYH